MRIPEWIADVFNCLDEGDVDTFSTYLSDDAAFVFANQPPVEGREAVHGFVSEFLGMLETMDHQLEEVFTTPEHVMIRGEVTYTRKDGSTLTVPFANAFEMSGDQIEQYQVYVDNTEL